VMAVLNRCLLIFASFDEGDEVLISSSFGDCCEDSGFRILGWLLSPKIRGG
jgi:hypothetical protein